MSSYHLDSFDRNNIEAERAYRAGYSCTVSEFHADWFSHDNPDADFPPIAKREEARELRRTAQAADADAETLAYMRGVCHAWDHAQQIDELELPASEGNVLVRFWRDEIKRWAASEVVAGAKCSPPPVPADYIDPKATVPEYMVRVPGFVSDVMDYTLSTAPYPSPVLAFCGAMALLSWLTGRKVCTVEDIRTNLFLLALALSGSGKDWPRKVNIAIARKANLQDSYCDRLASAQGLEDALSATPCMLFQVDEIDSLLRNIKKASDKQIVDLLAMLKSLFTSSNSSHSKRRLSKNDGKGGSIDCPHLAIFGTCVPRYFYDALDERLLQDGFFSRMLVLESGHRGAGQPARAIDPPADIMEQVEWWRDFAPGGGMFDNINPTPRVVSHTDDAEQLFLSARKECEREYSQAEKSGDNGCCAVWSRVIEQAQKLALLYACSENRDSPLITLECAEWAVSFAMRQARFTLERVAGSVAANPFDELCLRFLVKLKEAGGKLEHSAALRKLRIDARQFRDVTRTLLERGEVRIEQETTKGRAATLYCLA